MPIRIKLGDIVDELESQSDETSSFLNRETGELILVTGEAFSAAECDDPIEGYPEWEREMILIAKDIEENPDNYIALPSQFDIHEYDIMRRFCLSVEDDDISSYLMNSIEGKGAFRRFKDAIVRCGVREKWFAFRDEALKEIARDWCEEHSIEYEE